MSGLAELLEGIAALLWSAVAVGILFLVWALLWSRRGSLQQLSVGTSGLSFHFANQLLEEAERNAPAEAREGFGREAKQALIRRLDRHSDLLKAARIIWVDDHPENNRAVVSLLRQYGAYVDTPRSNQEAFGLLERAEYDVIVTDVGRDSEGENSKLKGVELANEVFRRWGKKVIIFTLRFDPTSVPRTTVDERLQLVSQLQDSVFGRTARLDESLHLILDSLEREA